MKRRDFMKAAGLFSAAGLVGTSSAWASSGKRSGKKILVIGGTKYLGPQIVEQLLQQGHEVTLFNRGLTNPHLFPQLEKLRGDRYPGNGSGLKSLGGKRTWDVVVDTWAENPLCVRDTVELLKSRCQQYIYVSTMAVYSELLDKPGLTEKEPLPHDTLPNSYSTKLGYSVDKRLGEGFVTHLSHGCSLRPHSICGFHMDAISDNQRYWPVRLQRGGTIAAPGDGADPTQYIDVKDVARFVVRSIEEKYKGIFNTFTTERFDAYLYGLKSLSHRQSEFVWMPYQYLAKQNVKGWTDMAMWNARQTSKGFFTISNKKALAHGLEIRPLAETFTDVINGFYEIESKDYEFGVNESQYGLSFAREKELLKDYVNSVKNRS